MRFSNIYLSRIKGGKARGRKPRVISANIKAEHFPEIMKD